MEEALAHCGLPVKCRTCQLSGNVKPRDYGGWFKSQILGRTPNKWFCPIHYDIGNAMDDRFYGMSQTPEPEPTVESTTDELYKLLD